MLFKMGCNGQTAHQLLFCADFLMGDTLKLLTHMPDKQDVEPGNICSLVALMYYVEPYVVLRPRLLSALAFRARVQY